MRRMKYTAQELYVLAAAAGKKTMYGIPDGFALLNDEEIPAARRQAEDILLDEGITAMDFDGRLNVSAEYMKLANICCDCEKCLTVNRQRTDGTAEDIIFWMYGGKLYQAEVVDDYYVFSDVEEATVRASAFGEKWHCGKTQGENRTVIPRVTLIKAKRYAAENKTEDAVRFLRQSGADDRTSAVIVDGLQERAEYLGLLLMEIEGTECKKTEKAWLNSRGVACAVANVVEDFRSCIAFSETTEEEINGEIRELTDMFLSRE